VTGQPFEGPGENLPPSYLPPSYPPPYYPPPSGQFPPPYYPPPVFYPDPAAPYGRHPLTGEPFSDKSKVIAGLLQLLGLVGVLGIGRIYLGNTALGITQLVGCLVFGIITCGIGFIVPVIWGIVDAVLIFTDKVRDSAGRPLRDAV
jgi:TM2 domain-containing membrane protein YozV